MRLILGSQSPRRHEILSFFSLPFDACPPDFDESTIAFKEDPCEYATLLALEKARSLAIRFPDQPILTADTVVYRDGTVYGKPADTEHAKEMLSNLSGEWHSVFTALALLYRGTESFRCQETRVEFHSMSPDQIDNYIQQVPIFDKAGAYAIQTAGGIIVRRIDGCYYNVMGLPLQALAELLLPLGMNLWDHLR